MKRNKYFLLFALICICFSPAYTETRNSGIAQIQENGILNVVYHEASVPELFSQTGKDSFSGSYVEILQSLCSFLDVKLEIQKLSSKQACLEALKNNKADIFIPSFPRNLIDSEIVCYTIPVLESPLVLLTNRKNQSYINASWKSINQTELEKLQNSNNPSLVLSSQSLFLFHKKDLLPNAEITYVNSQKEIMTLLSPEDKTAFILDKIFFINEIRKTPVFILYYSYEELDLPHEKYALAVDIKDMALQRALNIIIESQNRTLTRN